MASLALPLPKSIELAVIVGQPVPPTDAERDVVLVSSVPEVQAAGSPAEPEPVMEPPPVARQTPFKAKHPLERFMPLANDEEAVVSVTARTELNEVVATPPTAAVLTRIMGEAVVDVARDQANGWLSATVVVAEFKNDMPVPEEIMVEEALMVPETLSLEMEEEALAPMPPERVASPEAPRVPEISRVLDGCSMPMPIKPNGDEVEEMVKMGVLVVEVAIENALLRALGMVVVALRV